MEAVKIKEFMSATGDGSGSGSGSGYGDGSGSGSGDGSGSGSGSGYGYGYGYGSGSGDGDGSGSGYGSGYGSGDGDGYGDGSGSGSGSGYVKIQSYKGEPVYYIDGIPCVFSSIKEDYALVEVIDVKSFGQSKMYVAKKDGLFAHGSTLKEASEEVEQKWLSSQTVEEKIERFKETFKKGTPYKAALFYEWHTLLTGSCKAGKDIWLSQNNISLDSDMTVDRFIELTKTAYGGEIIRRLSE